VCVLCVCFQNKMLKQIREEFRQHSYQIKCQGKDGKDNDAFLMQAFRKADEVESGRLSLTQIKAVLGPSNLNLKVGDRKIEHVYQSAGVRRSDTVSYAQFCKVLDLNKLPHMLADYTPISKNTVMKQRGGISTRGARPGSYRPTVRAGPQTMTRLNTPFNEICSPAAIQRFGRGLMSGRSQIFTQCGSRQEQPFRDSSSSPAGNNGWVTELGLNLNTKPCTKSATIEPFNGMHGIRLSRTRNGNRGGSGSNQGLDRQQLEPARAGGSLGFPLSRGTDMGSLGRTRMPTREGHRSTRDYRWG
jgi:hypothetical protein